MNNITEKIIINNLGPLKNCELYIKDFMVFTGQQVSGKSTIAKSIFFFKNIKNLLILVIKKILKGDYIDINGEERLQLFNSKGYVKINFASSGQQEVLWILNTLFFYLLNNKKAYFIIEEPESNLFPSAQKLVIEFVSMIQNSGNKILLITHSPYVLGTLNNLLFAQEIYSSNNSKKELLNKILKKDFWIDYNNFSSYFLKNGISENCFDNEGKCIKNEVIDEVSMVINEEFDKLLEVGDV